MEDKTQKLIRKNSPSRSLKPRNVENIQMPSFPFQKYGQLDSLQSPSDEVFKNYDLNNDFK